MSPQSFPSTTKKRTNGGCENGARRLYFPTKIWIRSGISLEKVSVLEFPETQYPTDPILGRILLRFLAVLLSIFGVPRCVWLFVLVPAGRLFDRLRCREFPMVHRFCRILEAQGSRPELSMADKRCLGRAN